MAGGYRIAAHLSKTNQTAIAAQSQFAKCVRDLFADIRPQRIIETGTYVGTGTTTIIASALRDLGIAQSTFISIEVNPKNLARAQANLAAANLEVELQNGLSVPRRLLPAADQINRELVQNVMADDLVVDHEPAHRTDLYFKETDFPNLPDDLLGKTLKRFGYRSDFVMLDSGGHMGFVEFNYLIEQLRGECYIGLDDIYHVKHHRSFKTICNDARFKVIAASEEKFGFCIARFSPAM